MKKILFAFIILTALSVTADAATVAIIPFGHPESFPDDKYNAITDSFYEAINGSMKQSAVPKEKIEQILLRTQIFSDINAETLNEIGREAGADYLIFAKVGYSEKRETFISIVAFLIDIKSGELVNSLNWDISSEDDYAPRFQNAALKLMGLKKNIFPVTATINSKKGNKPASIGAGRDKSYYADDLSKFALDFNFRDMVQIDSADITINQESNFHALGCLGCATIVGVFFLPGYQTVSNVELTISVKYFENGSERTKTFKARESGSEFFWIYENSSEYFRVTDRLYQQAKEKIRKDINTNEDLFR